MKVVHLGPHLKADNVLQLVIDTDCVTSAQRQRVIQLELQDSKDTSKTSAVHISLARTDWNESYVELSVLVPGVTGEASQWAVRIPAPSEGSQ
jgi:hypothetical protein